MLLQSDVLPKRFNMNKYILIDKVSIVGGLGGSLLAYKNINIEFKSQSRRFQQREIRKNISISGLLSVDRITLKSFSNVTHTTLVERES